MTKKQLPWPKRVKALREKYGLFQREFAKALGIDRMTVIYWETNKREPSKPSQFVLSMLEKDKSYAKTLFEKAKRHE